MTRGSEQDAADRRGARASSSAPLVETHREPTEHEPAAAGGGRSWGVVGGEGVDHKVADLSGQRLTIDQALALVGGWGKHQKTVLLYCGVSWLLAGMYAFAPVTYAAEMMLENDWGGCGREQTAHGLYFGALFVGNLWFGPIADRLGRRLGLIAALGVTALGGLLCISARAWEEYLAARFVTGVGNAGLVLVSSVLISECVSAGVRSLVVCFYLQIFFAAGIMLTIPTDILAQNYRMAISLPTIVSFGWIILLFLDLRESPRYLLSKGHVSKTLDEMRLMGHRNGRALPSGVAVVDSLHKDFRPSAQTKAHGILDLWGSPRLRWTTLNLCFQWWVIGCEYYGFTLASSRLPGTAYSNLFFSALVEVPGYYAAFRAMDRFGRRAVLQVCHLVVLAACLSYMLLLYYRPDAASARTAFAMLGKVGTSGSFGVAYVYSMEVFPTCVRNLGAAVTTQFGNLGGLMAPQIITASLSPLLIFSFDTEGADGTTSLPLPLVSKMQPQATGLAGTEDCGEKEPGAAMMLFVIFSLGALAAVRHVPETLGLPLQETLDATDEQGPGPAHLEVHHHRLPLLQGQEMEEGV